MGTCVGRYASRDANLRIRGCILPGSSGGYADGLERSKWPGKILPAPECGFNTKILLHINLSQSVFQLIHVGSLSATKWSKSQKTYNYGQGFGHQCGSKSSGIWWSSTIIKQDNESFSPLFNLTSMFTHLNKYAHTLPLVVVSSVCLSNVTTTFLRQYVYIVVCILHIDTAAK